MIEEMWPGDEPTFEGERYAIEGAYCEPAPVQDPHPPILVGDTGEEVALELVARRGDARNTECSTGTSPRWSRRSA